MAKVHERTLYRLAMEIIRVSNALEDSKRGMKQQVEQHYYAIRKRILSEMVQAVSRSNF